MHQSNPIFYPVINPITFVIATSSTSPRVSRKNNLTALESAVLQTVAYTDQFQFPLALPEVASRLIWSGQKSTLPTSTELRLALTKLVKSGQLSEFGGFWGLARARSSTSMAQRVEMRQVRQRWSAAKQIEVDQVVAWVKRLPWVEGLAVTGSLAMENLASPDDDVDFLVVTKPQTLWLVRPLVIGFAIWHGKRRSWHGEEKNSWCFNLWLDTNQLALPADQHSLYGAYEVLQAKWVFDRGGVVSHFYAVNSWVRDYLPGLAKTKLVPTHQKKPAWRSASVAIGWQLLNRLAYLGQSWYMKPHRTREKVGLGFAYFHPRDTQSLIMGKLDQALQTNQKMSIIVKKNHIPKLKPTDRVLVTGVFDLLHQEHQEFLRKARALGGELWVGVESDQRVHQMKGPERPIQSQAVRVANIEKLGLADQVFVLPEQFSAPADHEKLIATIRPKVLAVSSHTAHLDKKEAILKKYGGTVVVVHQHNPAVSTTQLVQR